MSDRVGRLNYCLSGGSSIRIRFSRNCPVNRLPAGLRWMLSIIPMREVALSLSPLATASDRSSGYVAVALGSNSS